MQNPRFFALAMVDPSTVLGTHVCGKGGIGGASVIPETRGHSAAGGAEGVPRIGQRCPAVPARGRFIAGGVLVLVARSRGRGGADLRLGQGEPQRRTPMRSRRSACRSAAARSRASASSPGRTAAPVPVAAAGRSDLAAAHLIPAHQLAAGRGRDQAPRVGRLAGRQDRAAPPDADDAEREPAPALRDAEAPGSRCVLRFKQPVRVIAVGNAAGHLDAPRAGHAAAARSDSTAPPTPARHGRGADAHAGRPRRRRS